MKPPLHILKRSTAKNIKDDLTAALRLVADDLGVCIELHFCNYTPYSCLFNLELKTSAYKDAPFEFGVYHSCHLHDTLEPLAKKYRMTMSWHQYLGTPDSLNFRLRISLVCEDGWPITDGMEKFFLHAKKYGFKSSDLGKRVILKGDEFFISGLESGRRRRPVLVKNIHGYEFSWPCKPVLDSLGRNKFRFLDRQSKNST